MPYYVKTKSGEHGPLSAEDLRGLAENGKLTERHLVRNDTTTKWIAAGQIQGLFPRTLPTNSTPEHGFEPFIAAGKTVGQAAVGLGKVVGSLIPVKKGSPLAAAVPVEPRKTPQVDPFLARLIQDEQSPEVVAKVIPRVQELLTANEELLYIAVQQKPIMNFFPDCAVLTNRRFIVVRPKMLGRLDFTDYIWRDLRDTRVSDNIIGSTLTFATVRGERVSLDYLPKKQAKALYRYAQEQEELALEERRQRTMEENRAAAGGVVVQTAIPMMPASAAPSGSAVDPVARLQQLKSMLDAGLISQVEFDGKKAQILASM